MIVLHLSKGEHDPEICIRFPAEPNEVWSAIAELEHFSASDSSVEIRHVDCPIEILEQDIKRADLNSAEDIQKINTLAEQINVMSQQKRRLFSAVLSCECPPNLSEISRLAGDLDRYELLDGVTTDRDLGKWAVENRKLETEVPEAIWSYLDCNAVGREYFARHGGEFCSFGYLQSREAVSVQEQAPGMIRLTLISSEQQYDLALPASDTQLEQVRSLLELEDFAESIIGDVKFSDHHLNAILPLDAITVEDANTLALCLQEMEQENGALMKYCAVLEVEKPNTFAEALNIAMDRDDVRFVP